jgi:hypothetical protein
MVSQTEDDPRDDVSPTPVGTAPVSFVVRRTHQRCSPMRRRVSSCTTESFQSPSLRPELFIRHRRAQLAGWSLGAWSCQSMARRRSRKGCLTSSPSTGSPRRSLRKIQTDATDAGALDRGVSSRAPFVSSTSARSGCVSSRLGRRWRGKACVRAFVECSALSATFHRGSALWRSARHAAHRRFCASEMFLRPASDLYAPP